MSDKSVKATARQVYDALQVFRTVDPNVTANRIVMFLLAASCHPVGVTSAEAKARTGLPQSSISRHFNHLMAHNNLLELIDDPEESRRLVAKLSSEGKKLMTQLESILK